MKCMNSAWQQHAAELRAWLRSRVAQPQDLDDVMQDLFIKAMVQGDRFCDIQNTRAWLFEVMRNTLTDRLRIQRDVVNLPESLTAEEGDWVAVDQLSVCLPRVLSELGPADREAIELCDLQGLPQADYAQQKGLSLSTAKSRLQRARVKLREHLSQVCQVQLNAQGRVENFVFRANDQLADLK